MINKSPPVGSPGNRPGMWGRHRRADGPECPGVSGRTLPEAAMAVSRYGRGPGPVRIHPRTGPAWSRTRGTVQFSGISVSEFAV